MWGDPLRITSLTVAGRLPSYGHGLAPTRKSVASPLIAAGPIDVRILKRPSRFRKNGLHVAFIVPRRHMKGSLPLFILLNSAVCRYYFRILVKTSL